MNAALISLVMLFAGLQQQTKPVQKEAEFVAAKAVITYYIDAKGDQIKPPRKHDLKDKDAIKKLQKMFKEAFNRTEGEKPAGWKAGTWIRFENDKGRSREVGFNYKFDRWSWGKGDFKATKEMKTEVWQYFSKAKSK
ncbi:MAG: hypothetical protein KF784_07165 [Fimbriimonadaceae bacterium]|nr:hypothetical protein [Fimbriimonadaceae bacterium]